MRICTKFILSFSIPLIIVLGFVGHSNGEPPASEQKTRLLWQFDTDG